MKKSLRLKKSNVFYDFSKVLTTLALAYSVCLTPAYSQQIIVDGNTNTTLNTNGTITDVSTTTIKGSNAFNSFSRFNVDAGNTVNLVVPNGSSNLINLVHDEASVINGKLQSMQAGNVGGNIFLVNPHGITIGSQGVINVGSLTAVTPTTDFMNTFFTATGDPADASITALINGTAPINASANIDNQGKINAITDIKIDTGAFVNSGELYTDANYGLDIGDIINLNTLEYATDNDPDNLVLENGSITIKGEIPSYTYPSAIKNTGFIASKNLYLETEGNNSYIQLIGKIYSSNDININAKTHVDIFGKIYAGNNFSCNTTSGASVDFSAEIIADNDINLNIGGLYMEGSLLEAKNDINIESKARMWINYGTLISDNSIILNRENNYGDVILVPSLLKTNSLISNYLSNNSININNNSDINIVNTSGTSTIYIGNFDKILINGNKFIPTSIYLEMNASSSSQIGFYGNIYTPGEITAITNQTIRIDEEASVTSDSNINFTSSRLLARSDGLNKSYLLSKSIININSDNIELNGIIESTNSKDTSLLINSNGSIDSSSTITPTISDSNIYLNNLSSSRGAINITTSNLYGEGTLKAINSNSNVNITNNSALNLNLNNITGYSTGQIIINGSVVTSDIGTIKIIKQEAISTYNDITIQNNSASTTKLTGNINANNLNINSQGPIYLFNDTINSDVTLNTTAAGIDGGNPEIALGYWSLNSNLTINGNLSATATNGNIYYYGGTVNGNAVFNSGEAFDHRISVALGRFRPLNITGDIDVNSAGNVVHFGGIVGGDATVNAGKMVGFMNVNIGGDLDVDAQAFGFFGGSVGGDMNIDADYGILIGVGNLLTVNGNADLDSLYGPVGYYLGDVGGSLTIDAGGVVNVGNVDLLTQQTIDYNGQTYDITDLPYPVPADNNNFTVSSNLTINTPDDVEFEGQVSGLVNVAGDNITHIENGNVNIGTMNSTEGDIGIEANTGSVDINYISTTGDIDINARDGININTIDPANINLFVQKEGGSVNINTAQASNSVNIKADNVQGIFQNLNSSKALEFNVVGNDGNLANNVNISAASNTGLVFNSLRSVNADLKNLTSNTNLKVNNAIVTNKITISSDYIDAKDNVIFNDVNVSGTSGSPKTANISGLDTSNIQNSVMNKADSIINLPARTDIRDSITLDNDINQVNQTATEKLGEDLVYNVENTEGSFSVNKASGSIVPDNAEFYLDENYENLTKELLDQANVIYNQALENGESEEQAREKAKQFLLNSKLSPEIAKKLLEKQDFNNNIKFRKVLKLISLNN